MDVQQNTLYLTTPGSYVSRDHLTLQVEAPAAEPSPAEKRRLSIPIHHLESICIFGVSTISAPALDLCWDHGVAVHYLTEWGHLQARLTGVAEKRSSKLTNCANRKHSPILCWNKTFDLLNSRLSKLVFSPGIFAEIYRIICP
jgi:CRISPR/Cas system-associated endonuclease Cas1